MSKIYTCIFNKKYFLSTSQFNVAGCARNAKAVNLRDIAYNLIGVSQSLQYCLHYMVNIQYRISGKMQCLSKVSKFDIRW